MVDYNDSYFCIALGDKVKELRGLARKTRHELANELGVPWSVMDSIELGVTGVLTSELVVTLACGLGVDVFDLIGSAELSSREARFTCMLEDLLDSDLDVPGKASRIRDMVVFCIRESYACCSSGVVEFVLDRVGIPDGGSVSGRLRQLEVPHKELCEILYRLCDGFLSMDVPAKPSAGGRQDDRDEFRLDEIVDAVVVDFAVGVGEDAFVYVDEDYFGPG